MVPTASDWSAWVGIIVYHTLWPGIGPLLGPQGPQKSSFWPKRPLLGGLRGSRRAPGSQIWSQLPPAAVPRLDSWVRASSWQPGAPKAPVLAVNVPSLDHVGPNMGSKIKIAARERLDPRPKSVVTMSPTQAQQSEGVGAKYGPSGPFEDLQDPQKRHFGPIQALLGPLGAKTRPNTRPKCVVTMTPTQSDQSAAIGTKSGPKSGDQGLFSQLGPVLGQKGPLGPPRKCL